MRPHRRSMQQGDCAAIFCAAFAAAPRSAEDSFEPLTIPFGAGWCCPAPATMTPAAAEVGHLASLHEFPEGSAHRDNLSLGYKPQPGAIPLNIEHERGKLDGVDRPILIL